MPLKAVRSPRKTWWTGLTVAGLKREDLPVRKSKFTDLETLNIVTGLCYFDSIEGSGRAGEADGCTLLYYAMRWDQKTGEGEEREKAGGIFFVLLVPVWASKSFNLVF